MVQFQIQTKIKSFVPYTCIHLDVANGNVAVGKAEFSPSKWWQIHKQRA